ncbi:MAG: asparagine synthase (glutamine-hydrolyzing) [Hyphomicrobiales bacterium]|nr:MAG: asparagine synthase (glutamine-hydrolyzing) [Hyphomicrobiales bacterium]
MCGIAGVFAFGPSGGLERIARDMGASLHHRGPDAGDVWVDAVGQVALAHRRLAVVDLSPAGNQPMRSPSGRLVVVFNGEIYNHLDIRAELRAAGLSPSWRGTSDTETLAAALEHWGITGTLERTVGMFALAVFDTNSRTLTLARDRFGEKPLYYGWTAGTFAFASELKAMRSLPSFRNAVSRRALAEYLRYAYVPAPFSIYEDIFKLEPGCILTIDRTPPAQPPGQVPIAPAAYGSLRLQRYWSLSDAVARGQVSQIHSEPEALELLNARLNEAVRLQCQADVPLGAFLSGGVDSSAIVALMQKQTSRPVQTFTVAFDEEGFDESVHARAVARHLQSDHSELHVSAEDARSVIPRLPFMYDEPFGDSSQIPTHLLCQAARKHVTVALSGDAGDELFGGYNRYLWGPRIWDKVSVLPYPARQVLSGGVRLAATLPLDRMTPTRRMKGAVRASEKLHKLAHAMHGARSVDELYRNLCSQWKKPHSVVLGLECDAAAHPLPAEIARCLAGIHDPQARMMLQDAVTYLPDDILCKVDRAAMAISLETRVPFLDHRVAELAWRLPPSMKIRGGTGKWALRQILYRHVPRNLIERPKAGFAVPVGRWLKGPLREWAEDHLDAGRLAREGFLNSAPIRKAWAEHLDGRQDWTSQLWTVLMFQTWLQSTTQGSRA